MTQQQQPPMQPPMQSNPPAYREGDEPKWWWQVARHLDAAQQASINAMAHNLDSQTLTFAFQDKLREAQVILLEIFGAKGLLPKNGATSNGTNGAANGTASDDAAALLAVKRAMEAAAAVAEVSSIEPPALVEVEGRVLRTPDTSPDVSVPAEEPAVEAAVVPAIVPEATPEPAA